MADPTGSAEPAIVENNPVESVEADANTDTPAVAESTPAPANAEVSEADRIQKRIDKLTAEKYDGFRERDRAIYEAEQLRERIAKLEAKSEPVAPAQVPTLESSGYDESKYQAALLEHTRATARAEASAVLAQERENTRRQESARAWETRQAEFAKSKPDYFDKVVGNRSLPITQDMAQVIQGSDIGPQVAYYLAENLEQARTISQLPPLVQAREIGRIEARLEAVKASPAVVSKAPPPTPKIAVAEPAVSMNVEERLREGKEVSDKEFAAWRRRQSAQRR